MTVIVFSALNEQDESIFPERMTTAELHELRRGQGSIIFGNQYMNRPVNLAGNFLKRDWLHFYPYDSIHEFDAHYAGVDPSMSEDSAADWAVIMTGGVYQNQLYLRRCVRTHTAIQGTKIRLVEMNEVTPFTQISYESNLAQKFAAEFTADGTWLPIHQSATKGTKELRFAYMAGRFQAERILVPGIQVDGEWQPIPEFEAFVAEWVGFPTEANDDTLDAAEKLIEIAMKNPMAASASSESVLERIKAEAEADPNYFRKGGLHLPIRSRMGGLTKRERAQLITRQSTRLINRH